MKVLKWWKDLPDHYQKDRKVMIKEKFLWSIEWFLINCCTKKRNRQRRINTMLGNGSYKKIKKVLKK